MKKTAEKTLGQSCQSTENPSSVQIWAGPLPPSSKPPGDLSTGPFTALRLRWPLETCR